MPEPCGNDYARDAASKVRSENKTDGTIHEIRLSKGDEMTQISLFSSPALNRIAGQELKERGIERVAEKNEAVLEALRAKAREIATLQGSVTSDDVREYGDSMGFTLTHPNAYGAIFRNGGFEAIGWTESRIPSNHARPIRVWRVK